MRGISDMNKKLKKLAERVASMNTGLHKKEEGFVCLGRGGSPSIASQIGMERTELYARNPSTDNMDLYPYGNSFPYVYYMKEELFNSLTKGTSTLTAVEALSALGEGRILTDKSGAIVDCVKFGENYRAVELFKPWDIVRQKNWSSEYVIVENDQNSNFRLVDVENGRIMHGTSPSQEVLQAGYEKVGEINTKFHH